MLFMEDYSITYLVILQRAKSMSQQPKDSAGVFDLNFTRKIPESIENCLVTVDRLVHGANKESGFPHSV
jgi:hypothetical protein